MQTLLKTGLKSNLFQSQVSAAAIFLNKSQPIRHSSSFTESIQHLWRSISESAPVAFTQDALVTFHDMSGLPWYATVITSTILLRGAITLPLAIYQHRIMGRLEQISAEFPPIIEELKRETGVAIKKFGLTEAQARALFMQSSRKQWNLLVVRDNCHPAKTAITIWFQMPLWIIQSVSIRNLVSMAPNPDSLQAQIVYSDLMVGGFGWIPNLVEVDASWILPVALGIVNLLVIEVNAATRKKTATRVTSILTNVFRGLSILMVPIAASVPSCLALYWVTSSTFGLVQNVALLSPKVRQVLKVPDLAHLPKEKPIDFLVKKILRRQ